MICRTLFLWNASLAWPLFTNVTHLKSMLVLLAFSTDWYDKFVVEELTDEGTGLRTATKASTQLEKGC